MGSGLALAIGQSHSAIKTGSADATMSLLNLCLAYQMLLLGQIHLTSCVLDFSGACIDLDFPDYLDSD